MKVSNQLFRAFLWTTMSLISLYAVIFSDFTGWKVFSVLLFLVSCRFIFRAMNQENNTKALNAKSAEDESWKAYFYFSVTLILLVFAAISTDIVSWISGLGFAIVAFAVVSLGVDHLKKLIEMENATIEAADLASRLKPYLSDYRRRTDLKVELRLISTKDEVGLHEVSYYDLSAGSVEILLGCDTLVKSWWTTDGRVVEVHKLDQWAFVLDKTKKKVKVYESKVHSN